MKAYFSNFLRVVGVIFLILVIFLLMSVVSALRVLFHLSVMLLGCIDRMSYGDPSRGRYFWLLLLNHQELISGSELLFRMIEMKKKEGKDLTYVIFKKEMYHDLEILEREKLIRSLTIENDEYYIPQKLYCLV